MKRYDYTELACKAYSNPTQENLKELAEWFYTWGMKYWNGEYFKINEIAKLIPVYKPLKETEIQYELDHWELKKGI